MKSTSSGSQHATCVLAWLLLPPLFASGFVHARPLLAAHAPLYTIGDTDFRIPTGFIRPGEEKAGGTLPGINLYALVPDFLPYSKDTKKEFDRPMSTQVIGVSIRVQDAVLFGQNFPVLTRTAIYERILRDWSTGKARDVIDKQGPYGLTHRQL